MDHGTSTRLTSPDRRWRWRFATTLIVGLVSLYALTRSSVLPGDVTRFVNEAALGDFDAPQFANPGHVIQVPLARALWLGLAAVGRPAPMEHVMAGIAMVSTATAAVLIGWIALALLGSRTAAWTAALLYGLSLHSGVMSNGEQYGLAIAACSGGILAALFGRYIVAGLLFAVSMMGHAEFFFAAPAFAMAVWLGSASDRRGRVRAVLAVWGSAAVLTGVGVLSLTYLLRKWTTFPSLLAWIVGHLKTDHQYTVSVPEPFRALKGLATALTFGGHVWRDALTRRVTLGDPVFWLQALGGGVMLAVLVGGLWFARRERRMFLLGVVWLVPFHVGGNWWIESTVEKYHGGALPALVLLVTAGLMVATRTWSSRRREMTLASLVLASGLLNYGGAVLPIRDLGVRRAETARALRQLPPGPSGRSAIIACDVTPPLEQSGADLLRIRSYWRGPVTEIQQVIRQWAVDHARQGDAVYRYGDMCYPDEWITDWSTDRFDLGFLRETFDIGEPVIRNVPQHETVATNPRSWKRGNVSRLFWRGETAK